jgi:long-chain acyl-CoA synthetase
LRVPIINRLIRRRILRKLGLGSVRTAASGSAPLALDLLLWFKKLGLPLVEGYGTTEIGITHTSPGGQGKPGYVGRSAPGVVTEISPEGEVLVKSAMNMLGYYRNEQATREAFTEHGFLRTGDLGEVNADGWLRIIGRLKEQFKTSKGKYVLPAGIECMLNAHDAIESSLVMGSGLPAPFAVAVLAADAEQAARNEAGRTGLASSLEELLRVTNSRLAPHEWLKFLVLVNEKWSIEAGFLTPTLKMKRSVLEAHYAPLIPHWVKQDSMLIWHIEET